MALLFDLGFANRVPAPTGRRRGLGCWPTQIPAVWVPERAGAAARRNKVAMIPRIRFIFTPYG